MRRPPGLLRIALIGMLVMLLSTLGSLPALATHDDDNEVIFAPVTDGVTTDADGNQWLFNPGRMDTFAEFEDEGFEEPVLAVRVTVTVHYATAHDPGEDHDIVLLGKRGNEVDVNVVGTGTAGEYTGDVFFNEDETAAGDAQAAAAADLPQLRVADGDDIVAFCNDVASGCGSVIEFDGGITVDLAPPEVDAELPEDGSITGDADTAFQVTFSDDTSGVDAETTVPGGAGVASIRAALTQPDDDEESSRPEADEIDEDDGEAAWEERLLTRDDGEYIWHFEVRDRAGNVGFTAERTLTLDRQAPSPATAEAGLGFDQEDGEKVCRSCVLLSFVNETSGEPEDLDPSSVTTDDFEVDGDEPDDVDVFRGVDADGDGVPDEDAPHNLVVLEMAGDLASDAEPFVEMRDDVCDVAGNCGADKDEMDATDRLAPVITVDIAGAVSSRPLSGEEDEVDITIESDEDLDNDEVEVTITRLIAADGDLEESGDGGDTTTITDDDPVADHEWEITVELADFGKKEDGLYNVCVIATDEHGNTGTSGVECDGDPIDDEELEDADLFELDSDLSVSDPDVDGEGAFVLNPTPDDAGDETWRSNPFVRVNYREGSEYAGDSHGEVTITRVELQDQEGEPIADLTGSVRGVDRDSFVVRPSGLEEGVTYTLVWEAEDEAGNTSSDGFEFTVIPVPPGVTPSPSGKVYEVTVTPKGPGVPFTSCFRFEEFGSLTVDGLGSGRWAHLHVGEKAAVWAGMAGEKGFFLQFVGLAVPEHGSTLLARGTHRSGAEFRIVGVESPGCGTDGEASQEEKTGWRSR